MADLDTYQSYEKTLGDTAVSGLLNGVLAGAAMAAFLIIALSLSGERVETVPSHFGTAEGAASPFLGAVDHLAVSGIYGMLFALLWHWIGRRANRRGMVVLAGLVYAALLFIIAQWVLLPASESPLLDIPAQFGVAHLVYGVILGLLFQRA